jgi:hypothetical protein
VTLDDAITELNVIRSRLEPILDEEGRRAILNAVNDLESQRPRPKEGKKKHKKAAPKPWRLVIPPGNPLRFIATERTQDLRHSFVIDVACQIDQPKNGEIVGEHNIAIRVWTADEDLYFRDAFDAERIFDDVEAAGRRRVMLRFHFDHANPGQPGPKHHLQIGGIQRVGELCWYPENIRVPRFCHHPLSLLMACEFVMRTFFPQAHAAVENEPAWAGAIATAQRTYLPAYFELQGLQPNAGHFQHSLLGHLWNAAR